MSGTGTVTVLRDMFNDEVLADGYKHQVLLRNGQYLVIRKGQRWPDPGGDHGSTITSRERALKHFEFLESPFFTEGGR
jgi:hypothetical protein